MISLIANTCVGLILHNSVQFDRQLSEGTVRLNQLFDQ